MGRMIALCALSTSLIAGVASARCRAPAADDSAVGAAWTTLDGDVSVRYCGDMLCIRVGAFVCETDLDFAYPVTGTIHETDGVRMLVLRWEAEHGGSTYQIASGIELWAIDEVPRRLLSVVSSWNDGDNQGETIQRCGMARSVSVADATGITLGRRRMYGRCRDALAHERWRRTPLDAAARTWSWFQLSREAREQRRATR